MNETIIEYDINYEEYLRGLFPDKKEIVDDILKDNLKHIIYSQIGRDTKRNGETFHIAEKYKIFDMESKKNLYIDDQRIDPGLKELMWICNSHYTNRQDETLVKEITYKKTLIYLHFPCGILNSLMELLSEHIRKRLL